VRVVLAQHVTHHASRLDRLGRRRQPQFAHREEDATLHRLQAVLDIRQRAALDHRNGVFEVIACSRVVQQDAVIVFARRLRRCRRRHGRGCRRQLVVGRQVGKQVWR
jgi:hypothetical protein